MSEKPFGRPREHNREQIAKDLIEWAKQPDSINFNKFCALYHTPFPATKLLEWSKEDENFRVAYDTAKAFLGFRREEKLSNEELHVKAYDLNATVYDLIAKAEKQDNAKFEAAIRAAQEIKTVSEEDKIRHEALMSLLLSMQSSARKSADIKTKAE
jgi:hypothetical protein